MRFSIFLAAILSIMMALSASASPFYARSLPRCSAPCLSPAEEDCNSEHKEHISCSMCKESSTMHTITACISSACSDADLATTRQYYDAYCTPTGLGAGSRRALVVERGMPIFLNGTGVSTAATSESTTSTAAVAISTSSPSSSSSNAGATNAAISERGGTSAFSLVLGFILLAGGL
ncbi:hypothetical protein FIBSPDRAFT_873205 [Athelia psychrophila]|uniref:CFEM domain-containing protein n=1 Tax=Athelia psychrophila TaxID=1759441 RepID=A0A165YRE1_9AGAM|nr:hypothetical protein FIBSPDRAFT_873205 [Fibularhizoctonia sp. CBS 109695]